MGDGGILIVTVLGILFDFVVVPHGTKEPWVIYTNARVEKLYTDAGKIVATPMMNVDAAMTACPKGYAVRREEREARGTQSWIVWELRCR